ncbi:MAG: glycine cleavage system aminomethyltransferase GcvT [Bdellovibrionota bacterium]
MSLKKTPLFEEHLRLNAKMLEFAGFEMPITYDRYSGGMLQEHLEVRRNLGMFDVSHMGEFWISGAGAKDFLSFVTTKDFDVSKDGRAYYCLLLKDDGGILDDILVYRANSQKFLMVVNASNLSKDWMHLMNYAREFDVSLEDKSAETALIALQGPQAQHVIKEIYEGASELGYYSFFETQDSLIARTGYTGEDGFEIFLSPDQAVELWKRLLNLGVKPIGLGARDSLRMEVGFPLYGQELREDLWAHESLSRFALKNKKAFLGSQSLQNAPRWQPISLQGLNAKPMRSHEKIILNGEIVGEITSGSTSPSLKRGMGLGLIKADCHFDEASIFLLESAGKQREANFKNLPFIEAGRVKNK